MRTIATELVKPRHAYTSEDVPWQMDDDGGSALFRYLRGGGVRHSLLDALPLGVVDVHLPRKLPRKLPVVG